MPICDLCGAQVSLDEYCHVGVSPNMMQPNGWFLLATDKARKQEKITGAKPAAVDIAIRLGETFAKQADVRANQSPDFSPQNLPGLFSAIVGKLYFCNDCIAANGGEMTKVGVAFVRGKAKARGKGWWPF